MPDLNQTHWFKYRRRNKMAEQFLSLVLLILQLIKLVLEIISRFL